MLREGREREMGRRQRSEKVESRSSLGASAAGFRSMTAEEGRKEGERRGGGDSCLLRVGGYSDEGARWLEIVIE